MRYYKKLWRYLFVQPFFWVFYCFLQPTKFHQEVELRRIRPDDIFRIPRIIFLLFLCTYPIALIIHIFLERPIDAIIHTNIIVTLLQITPSWPSLLASTLISTLLGLVCGMIFGFAGGLAGSIPLGILGGIVGTIPFGVVSGLPNFGATGIIAISFLSIEGLALGIFIAQDYLIGLRVGISVLLALFIASRLPESNTGAAITLEDILAGVLLGFTLDSRSGLILGLILSTSKSLTGDIGTGLVYGLIFTGSFLLSYFGLLSYPLSAISSLRMYQRSRNNPVKVFDYLQTSALHWDERQWLPLPYLKRTLLIAINQNTEDTLQVLKFIIEYRPHQKRSAWYTSFELVIRALEALESLQEIPKASAHLAQFLSSEINLIDPQLVKTFTLLNDASRDAASYCNANNINVRYSILEKMIGHLKKITSTSYLDHPIYEERLKQLANHWLLLIQQEYERLKSVPQEINNPYNAGGVLEKRSSLFVGRQDIIQQLQKALSRGSKRPTFLLNGERRMGKTSLLINLPDLLGSSYIPIFYNLQSPGIVSNIVTFLDSVATEIYAGMKERGLQLKKLDYKLLKEASQENDEAVYRVFDKWFKGLELLLQNSDRTLLLTFDEFERLSDAEQQGLLNIKLLLSWFRTIIQSFSHITLLFSGVSTIDELSSEKTNWTSYFVNVQNLKVSFLQPTAAQRLITQPVHDFPGQEIYNEQTVAEILRVTGCHPFLVQAVCEIVIEALNADHRHQATVDDVGLAVEQVMSSWSNYFHDIWTRTDANQRECLKSIAALKVADAATIMQAGGMDKKTVQNSLFTLLKRDLIVVKDNYYQIATPIFYKMVEQNT